MEDSLLLWVVLGSVLLPNRSSSTSADWSASERAWRALVVRGSFETQAMSAHNFSSLETWQQEATWKGKANLHFELNRNELK